MAMRQAQTTPTAKRLQPLATGTTARPKIAQIRMNKAGTVTFDRHFIGMSAGEDFHVRQLAPGQQADQVAAQNPSLTGWITKDGNVHLLSTRKTGSGATQLFDRIYSEELVLLKAWVSCAGRPAPSVTQLFASTAAQ